ncbi:MAG TPA: glycerol-3-phosphate dehydrogenase/oxidase [Solirubrobacteraceae bacterium]
MSASLNEARRAAELERLAGGDVVDLVVVGGGITGAGVALDAASRGLSVALLERRDLAHGTSRWSSKLIHGGLRYLEHGDVGLAWESAVERGILLRSVAPHLLRPIPFLIPLDAAVDHRTAARLQVGGRIGDGLRSAARTSRRVLPPPRRISALEARRLAPALRAAGLRGGLLSWDCQLEDDARLVVAVARTAALHGARVLTYADVVGLREDGVDAVDSRTGERFSVRARRTIVAAGVWTSGLTDAVTLRPSRGSHLLVRAGRLGHPRAVVNVKVPGERGRWVFAIPRGDGLVAIGLTDVDAPGEPDDEPRPDPAEETELLHRASAALDVPLGPDDVAGRYAGLRPLAVTGEGGSEATADLSRRHALVEDPASGALAIVGGKLTTYRRMAQDAVDRISDRPCRTARLPLVGAAAPAALRSVAAPERLVRRYGTEAPAVVALADGRPELLEPLGPGVPACGAELLWAVRHELALTPADLADRRTRAGLVPEWRDAVLDAAERLLEPGRTAAG